MRGPNSSIPAWVVVAMLLPIGPQVWASPPREVAAPITVRIYDYASTPPGVLSRAREVAARVLAGAGIATSWAQCRTRESERRLNPSCSNRADASVLQLRIHTRLQAQRMGVRAWQFGYALPLDEGFGVIAGVFLGRARDLAHSHGLDLSIVLGHVMAHEIGHLLLGSGHHGGQGIMRPRWNDHDLRLAQTGLLGFTSSQAMRMLAQAEARTVESRDGQRLLTGAERSTLVVSSAF
jgi:hypothetical protein